MRQSEIIVNHLYLGADNQIRRVTAITETKLDKFWNGRERIEPKMKVMVEYHNEKLDVMNSVSMTLFEIYFSEKDVTPAENAP